MRSLTVFLMFALSAQVRGQTNAARQDFDVRIPISLFSKCDHVEDYVVHLSPLTSQPVYTVELFPEGLRRLIVPFLSEVGISQVTEWIRHFETKPLPASAMVYSINGRFHIRCRDNQGHLVETSGPDPGIDPLKLGLEFGRATIWHFWVYRGYAHVYVVTDARLETIDGNALVSNIERRLGVRNVELYVRNDPWFYFYSPDSAPYILADLSKALNQEQYAATPTMTCMSGRCRVAPSISR